MCVDDKIKFVSDVRKLQKQGMSEAEIARTLGCTRKNGEPSVVLLRCRLGRALRERASYYADRVKQMLKSGLSHEEVADALELPSVAAVRYYEKA